MSLHRNYEWHDPSNSACRYTISIGVASPDADWCSCPPPAGSEQAQREPYYTFAGVELAIALDALEQVMEADKGFREDEWIEFCNRILPFMHKHRRMIHTVGYT